MLALSSALSTAQDATIRNPLVEVTLSKLTPALPLQGQRLDAETRQEVQPGFITLHNNSLCAAYVVTSTSSASDILRIAYTDAAQLTFTFADVISSGLTGHNVLMTSVCETTEVIGSATTHNLLIAYVCGPYDYSIHWVKCSLTGTFIASGTIYLCYASNVAAKTVSLLFTGTKYIAAYVRLSTDTTGGAKVYYKSSTDLVTWSAEQNIPLTGIIYADNIVNCNLVMPSTGEIMLWFDHTETITNIYNLYYIESADGGTTWGAPNLVTSFTAPDTIGKHPYSFVNSTTQITVAFDQVKSALHMNYQTAGWSTTAPLMPSSMHFNPSTRRLYVVCSNTGAGAKTAYGIIGVNVDSWTIANYWNQHTVPALNAYWFDGGGNAFLPWNGCIRGEGNYIILASQAGHICLIDAGSNQIFDYNFVPDGTHGMATNVTGTTAMMGLSGTTFLARAHVDAENNKIYCLFCNTYTYNVAVFVGSVDIDHSKTVFSWSQLIGEIGIWTENQLYPFNGNTGDFFVDVASDMFAVSAANSGSFIGRLRVYSLSGAVVLKDFTMASNAQFPYYGLSRITFLDGVIYGGFTYYGSQAALRGLCAVDPTLGTITYYVPSFLSVGDMQIGDLISTTDGLVIMSCYALGIATFSLTTGWNQYNNTNVPGLCPATSEYYEGPLAYDPTNMLVFVGFDNFVYSPGGVGIAAFSIAGALSTPQYMIGTKTGSVWAFTSPAQLITGVFNQKTAIAKSIGGYIAAFWINLANYIYWDIESGDFLASDYLMRGADVTLTLSMDGNPNKISLTLANGYLFEQFNQASLLARYATKGKAIIVRFGETISGVQTWQPGYFRFIITSQKMSYRRGDQPVITIEGEDRRVFYDKQGTIVATPYFSSTYPQDAITSLLENYGNWLAAEIDMPTFDGETYLQQQWLDKNLMDIVNEIAHRYQYFVYIDTTTGKISARKINLSASPDHIYSTLTWLDQFTPDDNYSDFTNKVTVIGESPTQIPVNYPEERITGRNGTLGWWKKQGTEQIWYSDDKTKTCINPRLDIIEAATNIAYMLAGQVTEKISSEDPNNQYVIVEINAPDLTFVLAAAIAMIIFSRLFPPVMTPTGPAKSWIASITGELGMWLALQVLSSVGPYQYDIFAQPTGYIRQSLEASAYDLSFQELLNNTTIEKRIDEPLCHTVGECQAMADFEMGLVKAQRQRMKLIKVAHLQDEAGDIIQIPHPASGMPMNFYLSQITRKLHLPDNTDTAGIFTDELEGWKL